MPGAALRTVRQRPNAVSAVTVAREVSGIVEPLSLSRSTSSGGHSGTRGGMGTMSMQPTRSVLGVSGTRRIGTISPGMPVNPLNGYRPPVVWCYIFSLASILSLR
ncbi:hypothetical protein KIPB_010123 [Kipferlia bialata]|uniref:Uncharacterized protein n=1 Tax=Kipferlia bialata TaxID=797122 RepID=A0A391NPC3_9EUKA|nr:hypothetical protein KIPB_010123 [Kipferlia bialata]|eukprot:g10123.t1